MISLGATDLGAHGSGNLLGPRFAGRRLAGLVLTGLGAARPVGTVENGLSKGSLSSDSIGWLVGTENSVLGLGLLGRHVMLCRAILKE